MPKSEVPREEVTPEKPVDYWITGFDQVYQCGFQHLCDPILIYDQHQLKNREGRQKITYAFPTQYQACLLTIYNRQERAHNKARVWWKTISDTQNTLFYVYQVPNGTSAGLMEAHKLQLDTISEINTQSSQNYLVLYIGQTNSTTPTEFYVFFSGAIQLALIPALLLLLSP